MVTRCSIKFSVTFTHVHMDGSRDDRIVTSFVKNPEDWDEKIHQYLVIRENVDLKVEFESEQDDAKFYMDGLEVLNNPELQIDEESGEPYLVSGQKITLFKNSSSGYYPYIPAIYRIKVTVSEETFLSYVKVISNRLTDEQLDIMRFEVESQLKGLALDVVRKQNVTYNLESSILDPKLFQQFRVLDHHFTEISAIVSDLSKRIRFALAKEYTVQPADRPAHFDEVSIRHRLKHPESTNYVKSPKKMVNYNLPENRVLKTIIEKWIRLLRDFVESVDRSLERQTKNSQSFSSYTPYGKRREHLQELREYRDRAAQMKGALTILKTNPWYQELSNKREQGIPNMMYADVRYRFIWQIDRILFSEEIDISLHPEWRFHWKRTDQLYEIWGFLKVLQTLQSGQYGFQYTSGWLFDQKGLGDDFFVIPTIPKGTTVKLTKGDLKLSVVYDSVIPNTIDETDHSNMPIYTTATNNNPDIRVDVYIQDIFVGSILLEVKYRKKQALLDSDVDRQLTSYADNIRSPYIFNKKKRWEKLRPVHQVLVLYPEKWGETDVEPIEGRSISLIPLTPATDLSVFNNTIQRLIEELIAEAEDEGIESESALVSSR